MTAKYTFYTQNRFSLDNKPYVLSTEPPKWFSNMSNRISWFEESNNVIGHLVSSGDSTTSTYKGCPALNESFKKTIVIPCPCDVLVHIEKGELSWRTAFNTCTIQPHVREQHPGYRENQQNVKFVSDFYIVPEDQNQSLVMFMHPFLHDEQRFETVMGMLDLNIANHVAINTFFLKEKDQSYNIREGTPIAYIVPMTQDDIEIDVQHTDDITQHIKTLEATFDRSKSYWRKKKEASNV